MKKEKGQKQIALNNQLTLLDKILKKIESSAFYPAHIGWSESYSELFIYHFHKHFKKKNYLMEFNAELNCSDILFIHGKLNRKFDPYLLELYQIMKKPCYVIQLGSGTSPQEYCRSKVLGNEIHVDMIIPGNPPSPIEIYQGLERLKENIMKKVQ